MQSLKHLGAPLPNLILAEGLGPGEAILDFVSEISPGCQFHDECQFSPSLFEDGLPVLYDVGVVNGGQNPDLVESIPLVLFLEVHEFDLSGAWGTLLRAYYFPSLRLRTLRTCP